MKQRMLRLAVLLAAVMLLLPASVLSSRVGTRSSLRHYETRRDLSVYFSNADAVIAGIRSALRQRAQSVTVTYHAKADSMADITLLVRDLMQYVYDETPSPLEGDYLMHQNGGYELRYSHTPEEGGFAYQITIVPDYYTTARQEAETSEMVAEVLSALHFTDRTSDYEKVRAVYDYVYAHVSYDTVHRKNTYYHLKSTAYGALRYGTATCQGYAVLMYRLLREAGVGVRIITGYAGEAGGEQEYHAWNIVRIDGLYYNLDVTVDRHTESERCFLRCDANFERHQRSGAYTGSAFYAAYPMSEQDYPLLRRETRKEAES